MSRFLTRQFVNVNTKPLAGTVTKISNGDDSLLTAVARDVRKLDRFKVSAEAYDVAPLVESRSKDPMLKLKKLSSVIVTRAFKKRARRIGEVGENA